MKIILYGGTGMIGEGALIECLEDPTVEKVLAIVRKPTGHQHEKLEELTLPDFLDYSRFMDKIAGYDACIYALGISAMGMSEGDYRRVTHDFTVAAGKALLEANPGMRMCFISGSGTSLQSRQMWARVKGEAEQALLDMPFSSAHMFRPAGIMPKKGVKIRIRAYKIAYALMGWSAPIFNALSKGSFTDTEQLGKALIKVAKEGPPKKILEAKDIIEVA
jgi:uncharacterized protein YbjT (DUF2867 family)